MVCEHTIRKNWHSSERKRPDKEPQPSVQASMREPMNSIRGIRQTFTLDIEVSALQKMTDRQGAVYVDMTRVRPSEVAAGA
jgi:hypothetical protein